MTPTYNIQSKGRRVYNQQKSLYQRHNGALLPPLRAGLIELQALFHHFEIPEGMTRVTPKRILTSLLTQSTLRTSLLSSFKVFRIFSLVACTHYQYKKSIDEGNDSRSLLSLPYPPNLNCQVTVTSSSYFPDPL